MPRFALFLAFILIGLAQPLGAQTEEAAAPAPEPEDAYTITGVAVDVKAANATAARDKAFTEGGRKALNELAKRLSEAKEPGLKTVDDNTIGRMIKSFEVESEKASGSRYIGKLTFHFKPEQTDTFLLSRGLTLKDADGFAAGTDKTPANSEAALPAVPRTVILPIIRQGGRGVLWEEKTAWLRAFENYLSDTGQPQFVIPDGSAEDASAISASEALAGMPGPLMAVMRHYEARGVIVAALTAASSFPTPETTLSVQLAVFDAQGKMRNTSSFFLPAQPNRKPMEWLQDGAGYVISLMQQQNPNPKIPVAARGPAPYPPAAPATAIPPGSLRLTMTVPYSSPQQWQAMRTTVQELQGVVGFDIVSLTHSSATIQVAYLGSRAALGTALMQRGLSLQEGAKGTFTLNPVAYGGAPMPPPGPSGTFNTVYPTPPPPPPVTEDDSGAQEDLPPDESDIPPKKKQPAPPPIP